MVLVSFDIDGTLEVGDPPGIITIGMVMAVKRPGPPLRELLRPAGLVPAAVVGAPGDRP